MEYRYIGKSGLRVSPICMGTMTFGSGTKTKEEAFKILDAAYDRGINFYDTAELYPVPPKKETGGDTEIIVGEWLKTKPRDSAYGLTKANEISKYTGFSRFESIQNNFSLNNPRFLDELANVCKKEKISLLPYSPIGGGVLSGKYNGEFYPKDARFASYLSSKDPRQQAMAARFINEKSLKTTERYMELAKELDLSPVTFAVAWSMNFDFVASTIIGARVYEQLEDSLKALSVKLSKETMKKVEEIQQEIMYPMG